MSRLNLTDSSRPAATESRSAGGGLHNIAELARRTLRCKAAVVRVFEAGRNVSHEELCAAALSSRAEDAIGDAPSDVCTLADPLVADDLGFRFYAGIPLRTSGGQTVGVLAALDREPRELDDGELEALNLLGQVAVELVEARFTGEQ